MKNRKRKPKQIRKCERCGHDFAANKYNQKFCGGKCRWKHWEEQHPRMNIGVAPCAEKAIRGIR